MATFRTSFVPPPPPDGLTATSVGGAYVLLEWTPSALAPEDFVAYTVSRSVDGVTYSDLARLTDQAVASFADYSAPLDRTIYYRVTVEDLDYSSDPAEVTSALAGCSFWLVTPGAPEASFEVPNVTEYESAWPLQSEEHEPLGRPLKLIETGLMLGEEGRLTAHLLAEHDPEVLNLLRAAATGASTEVLLKTPYGEVFRVALGSIARTRVPGGAQDVSFRFVAV